MQIEKITIFLDPPRFLIMQTTYESNEYHIWNELKIFQSLSKHFPNF